MKNIRLLKNYKSKEQLICLLISTILLATNNQTIKIIGKTKQTKQISINQNLILEGVKIPNQGIGSGSAIGASAIMEISAIEMDMDISEDLESENVQNIQSEPIEHLYNNLTSYDQYLLAKLAECEAGNQSTYTKSLIIFVVLNRVNDPNFPNTVKEVIYQNNNGNYQFSPLYPNGSWYYIEPSNDSYNAVDLVMYSQNYSNGALYFEAYSTDYQAKQSWHAQNLTYLYKSDNTRFYK